MAITMHKPQTATCWWGDVAVDTLIVPCNGANDVDIETVIGSLRPRLLSCVYTANTWVLTFRPNTLMPQQAIDAEMELGSSTYVEVQVAAIDLTARTLTLKFELAAGTATTPPILATAAKVHLFIPRLFPVT